MPLLQAKLADLAGRPRGAAGAGKLERPVSSKSAGLRRLAQETGFTEEGTPAGQRLSGVYSAAGVEIRVAEVAAMQEVPQGEQRKAAGQVQRVWVDKGEPSLPESAQEYSMKAEREKWQVSPGRAAP